jgi:hypothetical protein
MRSFAETEIQEGQHMPAPQENLRWTLAAMLAGALLVAAPIVVALDRAGFPGFYLCLSPALIAVVPLLIGLVARLEPGPDRPSAEDLDRLVTCKRAGQLRSARRPTRSHRYSLSSRAAQPRPPAAAPPGPLDRLVQRKRELQEPIGPHSQEFG